MSEQERLSPERLAELEEAYESLAGWRGRFGNSRPQQSEGLYCDLWEAYQAIAADAAAQRDKAATKLGELALENEGLKQELAAANSYLSVFDCADCNHPYKRHIGSFMRCDDCFCDGYVAHREIAESRVAISRLVKQLEIASNQFRLAKKLGLSALKRNKELKQELAEARAAHETDIADWNKCHLQMQGQIKRTKKWNYLWHTKAKKYRGNWQFARAEASKNRQLFLGEADAHEHSRVELSKELEEARARIAELEKTALRKCKDCGHLEKEHFRYVTPPCTFLTCGCKHFTY